MKIKKIILLITLLCLSIIAFCSCDSRFGFLKTDNVEEEKIKTVVIDSRLLNISGNTAEGTAEEFKQVIGQYKKVEYDETSVSITVSEEQTEYWLKTRLENINKLKNGFENLLEGNRVEIEDDYKVLNLYTTGDIDVIKLRDYVLMLEGYCGMYQLFSNDEGYEWSMVINIYNSETGKLVETGGTDKELDFTPEKWQAAAQP